MADGVEIEMAAPHCAHPFLPLPPPPATPLVPPQEACWTLEEIEQQAGHPAAFIDPQQTFLSTG